MNDMLQPLFRGIVNAAMLPGIGDMGLAAHQDDLDRAESFEARVAELMESGAVFDPQDGELAAEAISEASPNTLALISAALRSGDDAEIGRVVRVQTCDYAERRARQAVEREACPSGRRAATEAEHV
jgi:hypothetical protein